MPTSSLITSIATLKTVVNGSQWFTQVQDMDAWLPHIVQTTPWVTHLSSHFILHFYSDIAHQDDLPASITTAMEAMYTDLVSFFPFAVQSKQERLVTLTRLTVFIVHTRSARTFGSLTDPHLLFYLLDPDQDPDFLQRLRHELVHWLWGRHYGEAPALFQEGIAVYGEQYSQKTHAHQRQIERTIDLTHVPPLHHLASNHAFWQYDQAYLIAGSFVHYLVATFGWNRLQQLFLASDYDDDQIHQTFERIYGCLWDAIDQEWRRTLSSTDVIP